MSEQIQIRELFFRPLFTAGEVQTRVQALGAALTQQYKNDNPLFVSILSGAFVFAADLIRAFEGNCEVGFVKLASYTGTRSTGDVQTIMGLEKELRGRHIIVVEDIVDTGRTLHFFLDHLRQQQPASLCTVALLRKLEAIEFPVPVEHVGFDIENRFVVGYGLDYDGWGRNLPGVFVLAP